MIFFITIGDELNVKNNLFPATKTTGHGETKVQM